MEILNFEQGSDEWVNSRLGIVTMSELHCILVNGKGPGGFGTGATSYMNQLIGERITGEPADVFQGNRHTERGHELEPIARELYVQRAGATDIEQVGIIRNDVVRKATGEIHKVGYSPDSLVGTDGLTEIKTKLPKYQVEVLISGEIPKEHIAQCQGGLWVSDREWIDFISYWPDWSDPSETIHGGKIYRILECRGCETAFFQLIEHSTEYADFVGVDYEGNEEWDDGDIVNYWPITQKVSKPHWYKRLARIDDRLDELVSDTYRAIDNDMNVLAGIGIRTAFDCASELLGVNPGLPFKKKLQSLLSKKKISLEELDALDAVVDAGSASAHRGWRPSLNQLETMMEILNAFIYRSFIVSGLSHRLKKGVPQRHK